MKLVLVWGHFMLKGTQSRASKLNLGLSKFSPFEPNWKLARIKNWSESKTGPDPKPDQLFGLQSVSHLVDHKKTENSDMHIDNRFQAASSSGSIELQLNKSFHYQSYYDPFSNEQYFEFFWIRFRRIFVAFLPFTWVIWGHLEVIESHWRSNDM